MAPQDISVDYCRFAVLGYARTGSNYLRRHLGRIDSVTMHGEVFAGHQRTKGAEFEEIWRGVFGDQPRETRAVGFKLFYHHLTPDEWETVLHDRELSVIHLLRRNRLRILTSLDIALATDRWLESDKHTRTHEPVTVRIDPETIVDRIEQIARLENSARENMCRHSYMELYYEEMVLDPRKEIGRALSFLGIERSISNEEVGLRRQNPNPLSETIENFDEIACVLSGTEYEEYLAG